MSGDVITLFQCAVQPINFLIAHGCFARRNEVETVTSTMGKGSHSCVIRQLGDWL